MSILKQELISWYPDLCILPEYLVHQAGETLGGVGPGQGEGKGDQGTHCEGHGDGEAGRGRLTTGCPGSWLLATLSQCLSPRWLSGFPDCQCPGINSVCWTSLTSGLSQWATEQTLQTSVQEKSPNLTSCPHHLRGYQFRCYRVIECLVDVSSTSTHVDSFYDVFG